MLDLDDDMNSQDAAPAEDEQVIADDDSGQEQDQHSPQNQDKQDISIAGQPGIIARAMSAGGNDQSAGGPWVPAYDAASRPALACTAADPEGEGALIAPGVFQFFDLPASQGSDAPENDNAAAPVSKSLPPTHKNIEPYKQIFLNKVYQLALEDEKKTGIPAAVTVAQAAIESGYGADVPHDIVSGANSNNYFGVKAGTGDPSVTAHTRECRNGVCGGQLAKFAVYDSLEKSVQAHSDFLCNNPRYASLRNSNDPVAWANGLQEKRYASDPHYAQALTRVMRDWHMIPAASTGAAN